MQQAAKHVRTANGELLVAALSALSLALACLMLSASFMTGMAGMSGMTGMTGVKGMAGMTGTAAHAANAGSVRQVSTASIDAPAFGSDHTMSGCEECVAEVATACAAGFALIVLTLMALLWGTLRNTFLGVLPRRIVLRVGVGDRGIRGKGVGPSPYMLCVMRT